MSGLFCESGESDVGVEVFHFDVFQINGAGELVYKGRDVGASFLAEDFRCDVDYDFVGEVFGEEGGDNGGATFNEQLGHSAFRQPVKQEMQVRAALCIRVSEKFGTCLGDFFGEIGFGAGGFFAGVDNDGRFFCGGEQLAIERDSELVVENDTGGFFALRGSWCQERVVSDNGVYADDYGLCASAEDVGVFSAELV